MAWVRIHDGALTHPKIVGLSDKAFRLWIWGLSYSQQHLTNGLLTYEALPPRLKRATEDLVTKRLWDRHEAGFEVHHYLDWNDSRDVIMSKREGAKTRLQSHREKRVASPDVKRVSSLTSETLLARSGVGKEKLLEEDLRAEFDARAGALLETYQELFVKLRRGARYHARPHLDFPKACEIVRTWTDDARLAKMIQIVLTTDDDWIARTDRGFAVFVARATWADDRLREWEEKTGVEV